MQEKEPLPRIYEARGEIYCFIYAIESRHSGYENGTFASITEISQYKKLPIPKRNDVDLFQV